MKTSSRDIQNKRIFKKLSTGNTKVTLIQIYEKKIVDFLKSIKPDIAKNIMKYPKIILEGMALWPGEDGLGKKILNIVTFISLCFMEWGHVIYVAANITDVLTVASACTTVFSTFQVKKQKKNNKK